MIYLIADTHFGHKQIIRYCNRPEDFEERIIYNWQQTVKENDTVIHLGDFALKKTTQEIKDILLQLPGNKILIRGNHDRKSTSSYLEAGFVLVANRIIIGDIIFSHKPIQHNLRLNIHGHYHNNKVKLLKWYKKHLLIKIEHEYRPVLLQDVVREKQIKIT